jgi:hypothetical protein
MFAASKPERTGDPWEDFEDAMLWDDCRAGCTVHTMALRLRRTEEEVAARMKELGIEARPPRPISPRS